MIRLSGEEIKKRQVKTFLKLILVLVFTIRCFAFLWSPPWLPLLFGLSAPAGFFTSVLGVGPKSQFLVTDENSSSIKFPNNPYHLFLYNQQVLHSALSLAIRSRDSLIQDKAIKIATFYFCQQGQEAKDSFYKFTYKQDNLIKYTSEMKCEK